MKTRILLVDDNMLFRKGIAALISFLSDFQVVGDLDSGKAAASALDHIDADLVLIDVKSPGGNGLEAIKQIKHRHPQVKVVLLTSLRAEDYVRAALRLNIDGFVLKDASVDELWVALRSAARGKLYLTPDISHYVVDRFVFPNKPNSDLPEVDKLTVRERGILQLIAEGKSNLDAAKSLCISPKTIEKDRASLMRKLGVRNATEMTLIAMQVGLVDLPEWMTQLLISQ
ncbi:response regulator transcription factor [Rhodoferax sp.]|uniref:response regulator transcription factor n=1 Tax=Rhodoferax sp. TaxID=50421 RepID=UPI0028408EC2|nr:response regulator transcription factor [Rhodoferax sp.]MDR3370150.1 response regulator transcription factor [Rhodoferax sp.]